jgi:HK97 family phage major capsid protein
MAHDEGQAPLNASDSEVLKQVHDLTDAIREIQARSQERNELSGEDRERLERLTQAVAELNSNFAARTNERKSEFPAVDPRQIRSDTARGSKTLDAFHRMPSSDPQIREFQTKADEVYLVSQIMSGKQPTDPRTLDCYRELMEIPMVKAEAVDQADVGTAGTGWYPVQFSAQLHENLRLARRVAALHSRINMPTDPFRLPIEGADASVYVVAESTGAEDYVTGANLIAATTPTSMTSLALTTKKVGARLVVSAEADEASIVALLPYFRAKLVRAMSDAEEDVTINGDTDVGTTAATDVDMQSAATTHHRAAWDGYRELAVAACKVAVTDATKLDIADLRGLRLQMAKYGINPADLVFITGPVGYNKLLSLANKVGSTDMASPVTTLDKYGPNATILTGELARVDGIPILVSEYVREDTSITGAQDGVTTDRTMILCVNRSQFLYGDFRRISLNSRYVPDTDQNVMVVLQRLTFKGWSTTNPAVGFNYNIQK